MDTVKNELVIKSPLGYEMSPTIGKLSLALSKAQALMEAASRDSSNPFYKSKYADLASVWRACRKELADNELAITQLPTGKPPTIGLVTILTHSSNEFIASSFAVETKKQDPQSVGSAISYLKRYALSAMVGIATDGDDDGNAASGKGNQQPVNNQRQGNYNQNNGNQQQKPKQNQQKQQVKPFDLNGTIAAFDTLGITKGDLQAFLQKPLEKLEASDISALRKYYQEAKAMVVKPPE